MYGTWPARLLLAATLVAASLFAVTLPPPLSAQQPPPAHIDADLLDVLAEPGARADYVVVLAEQADLSAAYKIEDWYERGRYVYEKLLETAQLSQAPVLEAARAAGVQPRSFLSSNAVYVEGGDLTSVQALAHAAGVARIRLPHVAQIEPSATTEPALRSLSQEPPAIQAFGWNLDVLDPNAGLYGMQAAQVWQQYGVRGQGIVVANIDTGAFYDHVALDRQYRGNVTGNIGGPYDHNYNWYQPNLSPCGNGQAPCDADTLWGHGTGTISLMAGETPDLSKQVGVAPASRWIACQGCDDPPYCTELALTLCADWMLAPCAIGDDPGDASCDPAMRPHVINNSWGGSGCDTWYQPYVQAWSASGIFPAFAAGNAGGCGTLGSPGDLPESFGVAAHFTDGNNAYAGGPSCFYETPTCDPAAHDIDPHVNAPTGGEAASAAQGQYLPLSGTSGACPHAAGTVALLWSANPGLIGQIDATFTILEQSANRGAPAQLCGQPACAGPDGYPNFDLGWGYLDALAAVEMAGIGGTGALQGHVVEAAAVDAAGDPLPDVTISTRRQAASYASTARTDAGGYYTLTLAAGTYTVTADGPMHGPATVTGVGIVTDTVTTLDFQLLLKGRLYGYVTDADSGAPVAGTVRTADAGPVDTDPATGYYSVRLGQGTHDVTVEANNYASQTVTIDILSGQELQHDFSLVPALALSPQPIEATVELGGQLDVSTLITNRTASPYAFSLSHDAARAGDEGTILLVDDETLEENPVAFEVALSNLGYEYTRIEANTFVSMTIPEMSAYAAVIYAGTALAGAEQDQIMAYLDAGGRLLLSDGSFTLYHQDTRLHRVYLQAMFDGLEEWAGPQTGLDIMAGLSPDISSAVIVYDSFAGPEGMGIFQAPGSHFSGIRTERAGYRAIFLSFDLNRIGAREPGDAMETSVVEPAMLWLLGYPVTAPWYGTDVSTGVIPAGGSVVIQSQFHPIVMAGVDQPGDFYAELHVEPAAQGEIYPRLDVPVHMTVLPRPTMGKLAGTVTTDRPGGPLQADVQIQPPIGIGWQIASDWWTGAYGYWLEAGDYVLTVTADGYYTETAPVSISAGITTTQDFFLTMAAPHISLSPLVLEENLVFGQTARQSVRVDNLGPEPLEIQVKERDRGSEPLPAGAVLQSLPPGLQGETMQDVAGAQILFDGAHGGNPTYFDELFADLGSLGATVDVYSSGYLTETALASYDILFLGDFADVPYRFDELDGIDTFVRQGGGLFVSYECCEDAGVPAVTRLFDIVYSGRGGTSGVTHDIRPHPTTEGVGGVSLPSRQFLMTAPLTGTAEVIVYDAGGDAAVAVSEPGNGKVFVIADQAFWDTVYTEADNTQIARNAFAWLYGGIEWLATQPAAATVAPGEALSLTVTFDAGAVDEPAIYYGDLVLANNDPLNPSPSMPVSLTVGPATGQGRLHGTVTSNRPGGPLAAAVLVEGSGGSKVTLYTDPTTGEYDQWLSSDLYRVMASATGYVTQTQMINVPAGGSLALDFELVMDAPWAATQPPTIEEMVVWGTTATRQVTITNPGLQALAFNLAEDDQGSVPLLQGTSAYVFDYENDNLATFFLDDPGNWTIIAPLSWEHYTAGDFRLNNFGQIYVMHGVYLYTMDTQTGDTSLVGWTEIPTDHSWNGMTIAGDGTIYGLTNLYDWITESYEPYLWTIDHNNGVNTLIGAITNAGYLADIAINLDGEMFGVDGTNDTVLQIDPATGAGTVLGPLGFDLWSGALDFDDDTGTLYLAGYEYVASQGHLHTIDTASGALTLVGSFPPTAAPAFLAIAADGQVGIPWLAETPTAGTVTPGGGLAVNLDLDASGVSGPGHYKANLHVQSNDPLLPDLPVPITMTVLASADLGQVTGVVQGTGHCDAEQYPLEATIVLEASGGMTYSVTSDPGNGSYSRWMPAGSYTATISAPAHLAAASSVQVEAMQTLTHDVSLRLLEPCLGVAPAAFSMTLPVNIVWTEMLTISNAGARELTWALRETTDPIALSSLPSIPPFQGELPPDSGPLSIEPLSTLPQPGAGLQQPPPPPNTPPHLLLGEPAFALDTTASHMVYITDTQHPGSWDVRGGVDRFYSGGDFWHGDFATMYALDFDTNELVRVDVESGAGTVVGMAHTLPGHHWTGLTAAVDGTLYGVSTECNVASALYTIDRTSGQATPIGTTTAAPCLIDVAINARGELYAIDISSDALFQLDPATAAATAIGLLGFNANHAQAIDFEEESGILYWAAVDDYHGELRYIDPTTANSLRIGDFPGGVGVDCLAFATGGGDPFWSDVPWLSEVPTSGLTLAGDAFPVEVSFDTTSLISGTCHAAGLGLLHDDAQAGSPTLVPIDLCIGKPWPVFYLTKTLEVGDYFPGQPVTYTLVWGNDGYAEVGIVISDPLPIELDYAWSQPPGSYDAAARTLTWDVPQLAQGGRMTATLGLTISAALGPGDGFTNTAYLLWQDQMLASSAGDWIGPMGGIAFDSYLVDDDGSDQSSGNSNGVADCGETIELYVDLLNTGTERATTIVGALSSDDPYVTLVANSSSGYPNIPPGQARRNYNDFELVVAPDTPDGHAVHFQVDVTAADGGPSADAFDLVVVCGGAANNPPDVPNSPSPADGATDQGVDADLAWAGGDPDPGDTVTYDVYLTANDTTPDLLACDDVATPACDPGTLASGTTYYWYVVATDNHVASTTGPTWSFTTEATTTPVGPLVYQGHLVDDDASDQSSGNGDGVAECGETIELYVDLLNQGTERATTVVGTLSTADPYVTLVANSSSGYPNILPGQVRRNYNDFELIVASDTPDGHAAHFQLDVTAANGGPWTAAFDLVVACGGAANSPPDVPYDPSPADGTTDQSIDVDLAWAGGDPDPGDTVTYDVYLAAGDPTPDLLACDDAATPACDPGTLAYGTTYYWYVVATDNHATSTIGPTWSFTTEATTTPVGPLVYGGHLVDDDANDQSSGNGNGVADCGETVELWVDLLNQGSERATTVVGTLSTDDPYVRWAANSKSGYPNVLPGAIRRNYNDFELLVAPDTPDGHVVQFQMNVTAAEGGPWVSSFDLVVACSAGARDTTYDLTLVKGPARRAGLWPAEGFWSSVPGSKVYAW